MIRYSDALDIIEQVARRQDCNTEIISISNAIGRILASDVKSSELVPSFTNSAMDGFAVFSEDTRAASAENKLELPVKGFIAAGDFQAFLAAGGTPNRHAVEIMTGAPLPSGPFDAVVRIEDVKVERDSDQNAVAIRLSRPLLAGENVRLKGSDFTVGQLVLPAGIRIASEHVLACTSLGIRQVTVKALPKVVILSTGSELVSPNQETLQPGMIRNSTGPFLLAALHQMGITASYLGIVRDDPSLYKKLLQDAIADGAEIIISTGAVSMGKYDFVPKALEELGATTHFHKVAIRPGKPLFFAELKQKRCVFFGVPGNPVSTAVGLRFFVEPFIRATLGLPRESGIQATLVRASSKPEGLRCFFKGNSTVGYNGVNVSALKGQASYIVSALLEANCWVVFPENGLQISDKSPVEIFPLHNAFERGFC